MTRISLGITAAILGGIALASASAHAQGLVTNQKLSAALANELVGTSVAECAKKNYAVTAAVVDLDGVRQAVLRGDGAPIHTLDNAFWRSRMRPGCQAMLLYHCTPSLSTVVPASPRAHRRLVSPVWNPRTACRRAFSGRPSFDVSTAMLKSVCPRHPLP